MAKIIRDQCANTKTVAQQRGVFWSLLRKPHGWWKPASMALDKAKKGSVVNDRTGRNNQGYECAHCKEIFAKKAVQVDHKEPIVPIKGWGNGPMYLGCDWNRYIERLYLEDIDGYQCLCRPCHSVKSKAENKERREWKKQQKEK